MKITDDMKTDWIPYDIDPIRDGEYEARWNLSTPPIKRYWRGEWLMYVEPTKGFDGGWVTSAFGRKTAKHAVSAAWRGLKEPCYTDITITNP